MEDTVVPEFHRTIIALASEKLGRGLTAKESAVITSRGGYIALEVIHDTIASAAAGKIEQYLNSE